MAENYKVYWQPGCTSCLRAKEFLKENGIAFESINVREDVGAMDDLARLGAMSIPAIALLWLLVRLMPEIERRG